MDAKKYPLMWVVFLFLVFFKAGAVLAQEQDCKVVKEYKENDRVIGYQVEIGGNLYLALSREKLEEMKNWEIDLKGCREKLKIREGDLEKCKKLVEQYKTTFAGQDEYIKELEATLELYKKLAKGYSKLKTPWVNAQIGVGVTGDSEPAVMLGLGFRKFRVYGFFQKENAGAMVGIALPLL